LFAVCALSFPLPSSRTIVPFPTSLALLPSRCSPQFQSCAICASTGRRFRASPRPPLCQASVPAVLRILQGLGQPVVTRQIHGSTPGDQARATAFSTSRSSALVSEVASVSKASAAVCLRKPHFQGLCALLRVQCKCSAPTRRVHVCTLKETLYCLNTRQIGRSSLPPCPSVLHQAAMFFQIGAWARTGVLAGRDSQILLSTSITRAIQADF